MSIHHKGEYLSIDDYKPLEQNLNVDDRLRSSVDQATDPGADLPQVGFFSAKKKSHAGAPLLSTAHISPFIEWNAGASLLKVSRGIKNDQVGGGKRGKVKGFSFASRLRLMRVVAKVKINSELPCFVTLTYPNKFPSPMESKKHLDIFIKRLLRAFSNIGLIWKLEPQERGAPHYHLLVWGCDLISLRDFIPFAWHDIAGYEDDQHLNFHLGLYGNEHCVSEVRSRKGVIRYAEKYLGKTFEVAGWDEVYPGRFWGVSQKENIPFGVECRFEISSAKAIHIMRYQRRFANLRSRNYSSLTTFSTADLWIKKCFGEVIEKK